MLRLGSSIRHAAMRTAAQVTRHEARIRSNRGRSGKQSGDFVAKPLSALSDSRQGKCGGSGSHLDQQGEGKHRQAGCSPRFPNDAPGQVAIDGPTQKPLGNREEQNTCAGQNLRDVLDTPDRQRFPVNRKAGRGGCRPASDQPVDKTGGKTVRRPGNLRPWRPETRPFPCRVRRRRDACDPWRGGH